MLSDAVTNLSFKRLYDELEVVGLDAFDAFLHDVVAVLVFHTLGNVSV